MSKTKILTVNVRLASDVGEFADLCTNVNGKIMLVQGDTRIPSTSRLGVISLCDGTPFNMVFTNCSDDEIAKFKKFECNISNEVNKETLEKINFDNIIVEFSNTEI